MASSSSTQPFHSPSPVALSTTHFQHNELVLSRSPILYLKENVVKQKWWCSCPQDLQSLACGASDVHRGKQHGPDAGIFVATRKLSDGRALFFAAVRFNHTGCGAISVFIESGIRVMYTGVCTACTGAPPLPRIWEGIGTSSRDEGALELAPLAGLQACRTFGLRWHRWGGVADGRKVLDPLDEPSTLLGHLAGDEALDGEHADLVLR